MSPEIASLEEPAELGHRRPGLPSSLLWSFCLSFTWPAALAAQPLTFQELLVDANASGDDKETADIDGDGDADGMIGGSTLAWYRSNGAARTFGGPHVIRDAAVEFTTDMSVADVDGDGDLDLVVADGSGGNNVRWYRNPVIGPPPNDPTVGTNWAQTLIGPLDNYAHDLEVGALDGVAGIDVVAIGDGGPFKIFFQNGGGTWETVDFSEHADNGSPAIADIDGDGDRDIFVRGGWIESPPSGRRISSNWTFHAIAGSDPGDGPATAALDVDRDGRIDLVTCPQHARGAFAWFKNPASPTQSNWTRTVIDAATGSHHLRVADFDGDGRLDLLTGLELSAGDITVWRISGTPPVFTPHPVAAGGGGHNAAVGDLDGNGLPDVWAADWIGNPPLRAYFNAPDLLLRDGFETGDTSRWSAAQP